MAKQAWLICLLLAVIVLAAFSPTLRNGFVGYDDGEYVLDNPHVRSGLSLDNTAWAFKAWHSNNWHPLTWLSHALDASIYGLQPFGHHLTSLLLHLANTLLLYLWLRNATGRDSTSAIVAAGFGLHPLHVESVAWVAERKDVLSTFFLMLTLFAYTAWIRKPERIRYWLIAGCLTAGLLSKQMLVTVPLLLLILDYWPLRRTEPLRQLVIEKLPLFGLSVLFSAIVLWVQRQGGAVSTLDQFPLPQRLANAVYSYLRYLGKMLWPADLSVFYPMEEVAWWKPALALTLLVAVSWLVYTQRRQRPWLAAGWAWYLVSLLPVVSIVQVGMQSMADRYMYIPMIGLLVALAWQLDSPRLLAPVMLVWAALSWNQLAVWNNGVSLFTHALHVTPDNFVAHDNLGVELDRRGQFEEALTHYRETLRIKPGDRIGESNYAMALFAKGERLLAAGQREDALHAFREGLRFRPRHALAHTHIGRILLEQRQISAALLEFQAALEIDPAFVAAHMGRGAALSWSAKPADARDAFETALRHDPNNAEAHYNLGLILTVMRQPAAGLQHFEEARRLLPTWGPAHAALAEAYAATGRFEDASREIAAARAANTEVEPELTAQVAAQIRKRVR